MSAPPPSLHVPSLTLRHLALARAPPCAPSSPHLGTAVRRWGPRSAPFLLKKARQQGFVLNPFLGREVRLADGSVGTLLGIGLKGWTTIEFHHNHEVKKLRTSEYAIRSALDASASFQRSVFISFVCSKFFFCLLLILFFCSYPWRIA